jgi:septal ring factor EnvC (AmiA/AmiB activator)
MFNWASTKGLLSMLGSTMMIMLGIGIGVGYVLFQPSASEASSRQETNQERITRLEASIVEKDARFLDLLNEVSSYKLEIARTKATNEGLTEQIAQQETTVEDAKRAEATAQYSLVASQNQVVVLEDQIAVMTPLRGHITDLEGTIEPMDSDRLLLVELRKSMPNTLDEAVKYWKSVKDQAVKSDPALGTKVDRVIRLLPTYFDWIDGTYTDTCDSVLAFFDSGAVEFGTMSGDLQNDIFLVMINRMDSAINLVGN